MRLRPFAALALLLRAGLVVAASTAAPDGYLTGRFSVLSAIEPAPRDGDARDIADRRIFRETRAMVGSPRYALATGDVDESPSAMGQDFACATGIALTPQAAPLTFTMIERASHDTSRATSDAKKHYRRLRPYQVASGMICEARADLSGSFDYPSGHTTYGWTWGYVLADLLPDRAGAILGRARAFGDSRYICGAHNYSAVIGGQASAAATMTAVRATPAYRADAEQARSELARLAADPAAAKPRDCDAERSLIEASAP